MADTALPISRYPDALAGQRGVLTIIEVARELRCSKAHVFSIINGKLHNLPPLPVLRIGRKLLIRYDALMKWLLSLEAREVEAQRLTGFFG